jgi:two-component system NtrC family response regulator
VIGPVTSKSCFTLCSNAVKLTHCRQDLKFPPELTPYLFNYRWPGNIREMENVIERLVLLSRSDQILLEDLPMNIRHGRTQVESATIQPPLSAKAGLRAVERELTVSALRDSNWNQSRTARQLAISRKSLLYRMRKYGIGRRDSDRNQGRDRETGT